MRYLISLTTALAAFSVSSVGRMAHAAGSVGESLNDGGIRGGLIVHMDCGDARLTASLHGSDAHLSVIKGSAHAHQHKLSSDKKGSQREPLGL